MYIHALNYFELKTLHPLHTLIKELKHNTLLLLQSILYFYTVFLKME
jgi:hypothetical protein